MLRDFWIDFTRQITEIKDLRVSEVLDALNDLLADHIFPAKADGSDPRRCPTCGTGQLSLKLGKFGAFIGCSNYPECRHTMQLSDAATGARRRAGDADLGIDPDSGLQRAAEDRAGSAPTCSSATARSPSARRCPRAGTPAS